MYPLWLAEVQHVHSRYICNLAFVFELHCDYSMENVNAVQHSLKDFHTQCSELNILGISSQHISQDMSLRAHSLQTTSCAAKDVRSANLRIRWTRSHLSVSRPQQDAKYNYLVPSRTRSFYCVFTFCTYLITRVNKREVDHYNCPLIGGGEIGLVKEI